MTVLSSLHEFEASSFQRHPTPSLEKLVLDDTIEAVFVATDAPSHARHCIEVLEHGKHVATAVPATYGSLEYADRLYAAVWRSGLKYMMKNLPDPARPLLPPGVKAVGTFFTPPCSSIISSGA